MDGSRNNDWYQVPFHLLQVVQKQAMEQSEDTEMKLQKVIREDKAKEEMIEDMKDTLR